MRSGKILALAVLLSPAGLLGQGWTYTPAAYPAVCTNPAAPGQWTMDYETATNRAAAEGRDLYLFVVGSTWCPDCNGLETQVVSKPAFNAFMAASGAYWVWLDFPRRNATNATQYGWLCHTNTGLFTLAESEARLARNRGLERRYAPFGAYRTPTTINMPTVLALGPDGSYVGEVTHYRQLTNVTAEVFIEKLVRVRTDDAWDVQDNRVPGKSDDAPFSATALTNIAEEVSRQAHTLSPTDSQDWFAFQAHPGLTYTFSAEGLLLEGQEAFPAGQIQVDLYTETNAAAAAVASSFGDLAGTQTVSWTWNQAQERTCYVKVGGAFADRAGYQFAYSQNRETPQVGVRFSSQEVVVSETAGSVELEIALEAPSAAEGGVRVFFSTALAVPSPAPFGTAAPGEDYVAVISNEVVWTHDEALQQAVKRVSVPLIQDLHPRWEGDERFSVALSDGLNSSVSVEGGTATVVLRESAKRVAGTLGFAAQGAGAEPFANPRKPAALVHEGEALVLWVGRSGGSDGAVTARVETVAGTAAAGEGFLPLQTNLVWAHGETFLQPVSIATLADAAYEADRAFKVRVTQTGASGVTAGAGTVAVTLRDQLMSQTLKEASGEALKFSSSGAAAWFFGEAGELRCSQVPAGRDSTLKTSVKGPGRLLFDWAFPPASDPAARLAVTVGAETRTFVAGDTLGGAETFVVTKAGSQAVSWRLFAAGAEPASVVVSNVVWQPLQKPASPVPAQSFVCAGSPTWLEWGAVAAADEYRVYLGNTPSTLEQVVPEGGGVITETRVNPCLDCILVDEMKHYWRVDAVMHVPGGGEVVVKGDLWPFSIKSWDGPVTELPDFAATDGLQASPSGAWRLVAGVGYDLGPFSMFYNCGCGDSGEDEKNDPLTYSLIGKLPAGLAMKDFDGATHFVGTPTKTGDYALWVQSLAVIDGAKVIGSTLPVAFSVESLQKAAGTFDGWVCCDGSPEENGSLKLTASAAGKLSAKIQTAGKALSFSKSGYDAETNGWVYARLAALSFKTAAGAGFTNTLAIRVSMAAGQGEGELTRYEAVKDGAGRIVDGTAVVSRVTLCRNGWKDDPALGPLGRACAGYYTVALPVVAATADAPGGSGYLTLTVASNGNVKATGVLADGKAWSGAASLLAGQEVEDLGAEGIRTNPVVRVLIFAVPSAYKGQGGLCGLLRLAEGGTGGGLCTVADEAMPPRWWSADGKSVYGYAPEAASPGFAAELGVSGGWYDSVMNLQTWYLNRALTFGAFGAAPAGYGGTDDTVSGYTLLGETPEGLRVTVLPQALAVDKQALAYAESGAIDFANSVNPCGLTLSFKRATGLLSGAFALYYQGAGAGADYKVRNVRYKGVLTPVRAEGGPWAAAEGQGFYLVPDASSYADGTGGTRSYTFNRSCSLTLESSDE